jgi:hypothetical protein
VEVLARRNGLRRANVRPLPAEIVETQDAVVPAGIQPPRIRAEGDGPRCFGRLETKAWGAIGDVPDDDPPPD